MSSPNTVESSPITEFCGVPTPPNAVILATADTVRHAIATLAREIQPWIDQSPNDPVLLVVLLEGGRFFGDRLVEGLRSCCTADFHRVDIKVSTRDTVGRFLDKPTVGGDIERLQDRRILIVDDILDSGLTLRLTAQHFGEVAREIKSAVLVQKDDPRLSPADAAIRPVADFVGLKFTDSRWFSGAGMDMPGDVLGVTRNTHTLIAYPPLA